MSKRSGGGFPEILPSTIVLNEILPKLEPEDLSSLACSCRTLNLSVHQTLSSITSLDLSAFSPDFETLTAILKRIGNLKSFTLNCIRLTDSAVKFVLTPNLHELNLLKCSSLSYQVVDTIGQKCPNLRVLGLELTNAIRKFIIIFNRNFAELLKSCLYLESLHIKIDEQEHENFCFKGIELFLPKQLKTVNLDRMLMSTAIHSIHESPSSFRSSLQCLSLVLELISDELIITIVNSLPLLLELDIEDRPAIAPLLPHDLTNNGLQSLGSCQNLTSLALTRSTLFIPVSFKRVNDMAMFVLSESCKTLESARLNGFSKVSDAGFSAILHSCHNLKKFEVRSSTIVSDLVFHDIADAPCSLSEVRLSSCSLITSDSVEKLALSSPSLEVLDLSGCRSVADACLCSVSTLSALTTLNLNSADVTDRGMAVLGKGNIPLVRLSLRRCKRVTDKGIALLLLENGSISKNLSTLDIGYMPGISDRAIVTIVRVAKSLTELSIRYCSYVTDASLKLLGCSHEGRIVKLKKLDLYRCTSLSVESLAWLKKPNFRGLKWVGVGLTRLGLNGDTGANEICEERPWITVCFNGCEMGCYDGWKFHRVQWHSASS